MKISIIMAYFNRKKLLINTLNTIEMTQHDDYEIIIVDDCSNEENRVEDLMLKYKNLKVIRLELKDKWYINPCIPFNIGINNSIGDYIILQNPECLHVGDVLTYVKNNLTNNNYISFSCYSLDSDNTDLINNIPLDSESIIKNITFNNRSVISDGDLGWYNHPTYRPVALHFTNAITKENLNKIGNFDESYAMGIGYDDNDLLNNIINYGLNVEYSTTPFVIHQNHYNISNNYNKPNGEHLLNINRTLFLNKINKIK